MFREILKGSSLKLRVKVSGEESRDDEDEILRALTLKLRGNTSQLVSFHVTVGLRVVAVAVIISRQKMIKNRGLVNLFSKIVAFVYSLCSF